MHATLLPAAANLAKTPLPVLAVLGILGAVEVGVDIVALVDLYRRPAKRVVGENKWIWLAVIILVNLLGAVIYLAAGRKPAQVDDATASHSPTARTEDIVDSLYGRPGGTDQK